MPSSQQTATQIANLALGYCGVSKPIADLATDRTIEAQMIKKFYDPARRQAIRDGRWLFTVKQLSPGIVAQQPTPEWLYAYEYPSDCLKIFRFVSWRLNNDTRQSRIPYTLMQPVPVNLSTLTTPPTSYAENSGLWIYTNWPGVNGSAIPTILEYAFDNTNVAQWTDDFCLFFALALACLVAPTLSNGDAAMKAGLKSDYKEAKESAGDMDLNEEQRPQDPQAEWINARDGLLQNNVYGQQWAAEPSGFIVE